MPILYCSLEILLLPHSIATIHFIMRYKLKNGKNKILIDSYKYRKKYSSSHMKPRRSDEDMIYLPISSQYIVEYKIKC